MNSSNLKAKDVAALVAGAAVIGAGLGLLYSPQAGCETRKKIRHYAKKGKVQATRAQRSMKTQFSKAVEYGKTVLPRKDGTRTPIAVSA